jgi:hypothetical protein
MLLQHVAWLAGAALSLEMEAASRMETNLEQRPFGDAVFAENPENRCPVLLLLDNSGSMQGRPIGELNTGLQVFRAELFADSLAAKRVEVGIVTSGPVKTETDFTGIQYFQACAEDNLEVLWN